MAASHETLSAVITAGDAVASKAIYGQSKAFLAVAGRPMVVRLVLTLQQVPEVSDVWVVGNLSRLKEAFDRPDVQAELQKPLHLVEQGRNLLENAWETYRKILKQDTKVGRDPVGEEVDLPIFFLSADLPFATPEELSVFARRSLLLPRCDYALGLVSEEAMREFAPQAAGEPGIEVAFFNIREGRLRQSNLHFARPARIGNLDRIEEMYEFRHQKQFFNMAGLALKLFFSQIGGPRIFFFYLIMHVAGLVDRWGLRRLADLLRRGVSLARIEQTISALLDTRFRFLVTEAGGCGVDVDTEQEYDVVSERFDALWAAQKARAEKLYGPATLGPPSLEPRDS
jgi:GTP:adenosylcobinamide-phosphate guanylyltransferase